MNRRVVDNYGTIIYYLNDNLHREDGPALEYDNGDKQYWVNGKLHRLDGPAIEYSSPTMHSQNQWHYKGLRVVCSNQQEFEKFLKLRAFL
jgi:hypothetical protein